MASSQFSIKMIGAHFHSSARDKMELIISPEATKNKTSKAPSSAPHIWKDGLGILDIDIQQNFVNIKWIQRLIESYQYATKTRALGK